MIYSCLVAHRLSELPKGRTFRPHERAEQGENRATEVRMPKSAVLMGLPRMQGGGEMGRRVVKAIEGPSFPAPFDRNVLLISLLQFKGPNP